MEFHPVTAALGAEVSGIDLAQPLDAKTADALHAGLVEHQVLFFEIRTSARGRI